jgi:hypothetical protein
MRVLGYLVFFAAFAVPFSLTADTQAPDAAQVLTAAREAMGGEKKLAGVQSFVATGRTRQVRGNNLVPIVFEISCELPDKYVRIDEFPAQDQDPTTSGFNANNLIQVPPPPPAAAGRGAGPGGGPDPAQRRVITLKQDFARLTLGMFATSFPAYPLTFKYAAEGDAPEGKADVIDVAGPANFSAQLVVQRSTHLPVMLIWHQAPPAAPQRGRGQPPPGQPSPGQPSPGQPAPSPAAPVEYRLYYGDFRDVDGMKFPFRLRRAIAGETVEETTFDKFRINPKIDAKKFEAVK